MKTASNVTRWIALGLSIFLLVEWSLGAAVLAVGILILAILFLIPVVGWAILLCLIPAILSSGLYVLFTICATTFSLIALIGAVSKLAKNKHKISTGVLVAVTSLLSSEYFFTPLIVGALIIVSASFKKAIAKKNEE